MKITRGVFGGGLTTGEQSPTAEGEKEKSNL